MGAQTAIDGDDKLTSDMVTQYAYCPRRMHLMYVEGRWADNVYTEHGKEVHRRVDADDDPLPAPTGGDEPPAIGRSVTLGSDDLGLIAKLDLVEVDGATATPVETKRGKVPDNAERSWEPERVQVMAQGLLLREHGLTCEGGVLYFHGSRTRVPIAFTPELEARTRHLLAQAREAMRARTMPAPLIDSPKCRGCSLNGICLPDETHALSAVPAAPGEVRRLYPARDDAVPAYVQEQGAVIGKAGESFSVKRTGDLIGDFKLKDTSQLVLCGNVQITAQALHLACEAGIPVVHLSLGHWFYGITAGFGLRNAYDRAAQFVAAADPVRCLAFARAVVAAKGANQRTLLRRNATPTPARELREMADLLIQVPAAADLGQCLGYEGNLAERYFSAFSTMVRPKGADDLPGQGDEPAALPFDFTTRNRRPPRDPVNALLSFGYAMLAKDCAVALAAIGLDPHWGLYHQPRHGRPSLALDLMEEFRPLIVDSAVLSAINTGMVTAADFVIAANGCQLTAPGRKAFLRAYEARCDQMATHPTFDYRLSWRRMIALQAQILARWLRGDLPVYTGITTR
jgi:CRISPR-associated protein Cas1